MISARSVLVVVAHPDDEVLGCGGFLAHLAARSADHRAYLDQAGLSEYADVDAPVSDIHVLILADGEASRDPMAMDAQARVLARERMTRAALDALGVSEPPEFGRLADQRLDEVALLDLARIVESAIVRHQPDLVLTHHAGDLNLDHALVARATLTACRPLAASPVRAVMAFEVPSATEWGFGTTGAAFQPDTFVPIDVDRKLAAMACYAPEMRAHPHPRSAEAIRALAVLRGGQCGLDAAEGFSTIWRKA